MPERSTYERAALEYCAPRGIRLSDFLDLWSQGDQLAALEWQAEQSWRCSECGLDSRETVGPKHEDRWNAELSGHCDGCRAKERARATIAGDDHLNPNAGARLRFWRDEEVADGSVDEPRPAGGEARPVRP